MGYKRFYQTFFFMMVNFCLIIQVSYLCGSAKNIPPPEKTLTKGIIAKIPTENPLDYFGFITASIFQYQYCTLEIWIKLRPLWHLYALYSCLYSIIFWLCCYLLFDDQSSFSINPFPANVFSCFPSWTDYRWV